MRTNEHGLDQATASSRTTQGHVAQAFLDAIDLRPRRKQRTNMYEGERLESERYHIQNSGTHKYVIHLAILDVQASVSAKNALGKKKGME